jgi:hypothetical protein
MDKTLGAEFEKGRASMRSVTEAAARRWKEKRRCES